MPIPIPGPYGVTSAICVVDVTIPCMPALGATLDTRKRPSPIDIKGSMQKPSQTLEKGYVDSPMADVNNELAQVAKALPPPSWRQNTLGFG